MMTLEERTAPGFAPLLKGYAETAPEEHAGTVYGLWPDLRLAYFNPAWVAFVRDNGGPPGLASPASLGLPVMAAIPAPLHAFFAELYRSALAADRPPRHPVSHRYECSSPERFREFVMILYPLGRHEGLLVVNSLVAETPHDPALRPACLPDWQAYADANNVIHQCCHCRRIEHMGVAKRWDWVPDWVRQPPPETSHTICPVCFEHYYPDL